MEIIKIINFIILLFYVIGAYLFIASPVYRIFDKLTHNVYYIEISATALFTISNIMILIIFIKNKSIKHTDKYIIKLIIRILFILGSSSFMTGSTIRIYDSISLKNVYVDMSASIYFCISGGLDLY